VAGWDPLVNLFFRGGTSGALGVLVLIAVTSVAVIVFFLRRPAGENVWRRLVAPVIATAALAVVLYLAMDNFGTLLGVPPGHVLVWLIPAIYAAAIVLGVLWGLVLKATRPEVYRGIGLGAKSATVGVGDSMFPAVLESAARDGGAR
jgi:hypothetical protein